MTQERAIELAKGYAAERIRDGHVVEEASNIIETEWDVGVPVWVVHFEYVLDEGVECQEPSALAIVIDKRTGERIPFVSL